MNKEKVKEIIRFSFFKYFQNPWFIIFNFLTLVSILVMFNWNTLSKVVDFKKDEKVVKIAVLDDNNIIDEKFFDVFEGNKKYETERISENNYTSENIPDDFIIVEVTPDNDEIIKSNVISKEGISTEAYDLIALGLKNIRNRILESRYVVSKERLELFQKDVFIHREMLGVDAENSDLKNLINLFASCFTYLVSVIIFSRIASEIAQEKSTKASEYVLTAVSAKEYLFSKVFSNIGILIIQFVLMLSYYVGAVGLASLFKVSSTDISLSSALSVSGLSTDIVVYLISLIFYNIITLTLLCIVQATLAAKTSSSQEAGNSVSILVFVMMLMYIFTNSVIDPYSKANIALYIVSMLPIVSSFFVPAMMVIGQATWWQVLISVLLLICLIPKSFSYCSKVFKNGLLDYTKKRKSIFEVGEDNSLEYLMNKRNFKRLGSAIGIAIILYIGTQTIISLLINLVISTFFKDILSETDQFLLLQMFTQILSLGIAYYFVRAYIPTKENKPSKDLKIKKSQIVIMTLAFVIVFQVVLGILYEKLGLDYSVTELFTMDYTAPLFSKILLIIAIAATPAIMEELFFRKAIIDMCKVHGKKFALIMSAFLFGFIHMNLSQGVFAFILGMVLGLIYLYTNDIKITMLIHFINNGYAALEMIAKEGGTLSLCLLVIVIATLVLGIACIVSILLNKEIRDELKNKIKSIKFNNGSSKYAFMLYDYIFDISMALLLVLSLMQEKMFRS